MIKRLAVSLVLLLTAMVLVFGDWAASDQTVPGLGAAGVDQPVSRSR
jgi:hypothetical protein